MLPFSGVDNSCFLSTAVQFTSLLQIIAEHPEKLLHDDATRPALDVLKAIPATWDETRVLAPSAIGEFAVMARRKDTTRFLGILNGDTPTVLDRVDLSFLGERRYRATVLTSPARYDFVRRELSPFDAQTPLGFTLAAGDGAVVRFVPEASPQSPGRDLLED